MTANTLTYFTVLKVSIAERLVYRFDFFFSTFLRFIPIITTIFLWRAIFDGRESDKIGDMQYEHFVAYYLFIMISKSFGSMPGLASGIARDVREGELRKFLIQPVDYMLYKLALRVSHKAVYFLMAGLPFTAVFMLCRDYLPDLESLSVILMYILSLCFAFVIGFSFHFCLGMISFWFLEIGSFLHVIMVMQYFLSGHMFPLSLLPDSIQPFVMWTPFVFETYYPARIILGLESAGNIPMILFGQLFWIVVLLTSARILWKRGLKKIFSLRWVVCFYVMFYVINFYMNNKI